MSNRLLALLKGTIFHPQWMTDRYHIRSKEVLKELRGLLVLDIGSGDAQYLRLINTSNSLFTLDYPVTNKKYRSAPDIFADAQYLPIANEQVDVVLLYEVLEHIVDMQKVLSETNRVLRPGGKLFLSVPFIYPIHDAPNDYWRFTQFGLSDVLARNGFEVEKLVVQGNTLAAALQMFNLGLLEVCRDLLVRNYVVGVTAGLMVYPVTIVVNMLAWPILNLPLGRAGSFGYFIVAEKSK